MNRIDKITLDKVLPRVFVGEEDANRRESGVWNTDAELKRGQCYCINAASGTGKTSLCSFLLGVRHDYIGTISFDGENIDKYGVGKWCELRRSHLAYLPQELELFDELTASENVMLKNRLTDFRTEGEIKQMFERLGIDNRYDYPAGRMSVGQRQRVALIRALCQPFDFILLDEPVSHLDKYNNAICGQMVVEAARKGEAGIIYTSVGNPLIVECPIIPLDL